jgi:dimethylaniline monooxygenase (N-oxide forming)
MSLSKQPPKGLHRRFGCIRPVCAEAFDCPGRSGPQLKRVAVVGSGVSGLAAAKAFLEEGHFEVKVFEQQQELGGLWVNTYESARIQNGKSMYEFSDWPMPEAYPVLPSKDQVKAYLQTYASRFSIEHINFQRRVARMRKMEPNR